MHKVRKELAGEAKVAKKGASSVPGAVAVPQVEAVVPVVATKAVEPVAGIPERIRGYEVIKAVDELWDDDCETMYGQFLAWAKGVLGSGEVIANARKSTTRIGGEPIKVVVEKIYDIRKANNLHIVTHI
ncbi:MAG: hypothetical protein C4292_01210 [Nitrososphaera sp.]